MPVERTVTEKVEVTTTGNMPPIVPVVDSHGILRPSVGVPISGVPVGGVTTSTVTTCTEACPPGVHHDHHHHHHSSTSAHETVHESAEHSTHSVHTEVRAPLISAPAPFISTSVSGLAQDIVSEGFTASAARISAGATSDVIVETDEMRRKAAVERERYDREHASVDAHYQKELEKKTEKYRKEAEEQAEKIRKEMEKQHHKDIEFRKEMVKVAIDKQEKEVEIEAKLAKKELELERQKALDALERSKMSTNIEVKFDSAAGVTHSEGTVVSESMDVHHHPRM